MGFMASMFGGSNPTINSGIKQAGDTTAFTSNLGKNLTTQASDFWSDLMSGDPSKTAKLLAPQISGMQKRAQQQKQTMAQFGNRSGGTNAKAQTIDDQTRGSINDMINQLTGAAAGQVTSMGQNMIDTGMKSLGQQVDFSQQQMENWANSIFGRGMTQAASAAETYAMGG